MRRAQAAMEFLMTYGWAILIVLIAIAALAYFGILSPGRLLPSSCILFSGIACTDFRVTPETVSILVQNGFGKKIEILEVNSLDSNCDPFVGTRTIEDGSRSGFVLGGCDNGDGGGRFSSNIEINYKLDSLIHTRIGKIVSQVEQIGSVIIIGSGSYTPNEIFEEDSIQNTIGDEVRTAGDSYFFSGYDEGATPTDYVQMALFPDIAAGAGTLSSLSLDITHREDLSGCGCSGASCFTDDRREVQCYDGTNWIDVISPYTLYDTGVFFTDSVDLFGPPCNINTNNKFNDLGIRVTFDPVIDACGHIDLDYVGVNVGII